MMHDALQGVSQTCIMHQASCIVNYDSPRMNFLPASTRSPIFSPDEDSTYTLTTGSVPEARISTQLSSSSMYLVPSAVVFFPLTLRPPSSESGWLSLELIWERLASVKWILTRSFRIVPTSL